MNEAAHILAYVISGGAFVCLCYLVPKFIKEQYEFWKSMDED